MADPPIEMIHEKPTARMGIHCTSQFTFDADIFFVWMMGETGMSKYHLIDYNLQVVAVSIARILKSSFLFFERLDCIQSIITSPWSILYVI